MCFSFLSELYDWAKEWQSLIAGVLALVAAYMTVSAIKDQIRESKAAADVALKQVEAHEERRWKSKRNAARAVMPLSLTALVDYSESCAEFLTTLLATRNGESIPRNPQLVLPSLPLEAIGGLKNVIELTEGKVAKHLATLLAKLQIQHSRMRGSVRALISGQGGRIVLAKNIEGHLIDTAIISAFTSSFFEYARFEKDDVPESLPYDEVFTALHVMGIYDHQVARVYETLNRRKDKSTTVDLGAITIEEPRPQNDANA